MAHDDDTNAERGDKGFRRWFTPWRLMISSVGLLLVLCFVAWGPIGVAYHRWQVERLSNRVHVSGYPTKLDRIEERIAGERTRRINDHLRSLTIQGAAISHHFRFQHVTEGTKRLRTLGSTLWTGRCPPSFHYAFVPGDDPTIVVLGVSCEPEYSKAWREFIADFDVPHPDNAVP